MEDKTPFELGIPTAWEFTKIQKYGGPFLFQDFRRSKPSVINSIMAMYAELFLRIHESPGYSRQSYALGRGAISWLKKVRRLMLLRAKTARKVHDRSFTGQIVDMARAWKRCNLSPNGYYHGQLARHAGGVEVTQYLDWEVLLKIFIELQRDTFGAPSFNVNDKAEFGAWCRVNEIPSPREISLSSDSPPPAVDKLSRLGKSLFVKQRAGKGGDNAEAWDLNPDGLWHSNEHALTTRELANLLARRAANDSVGLVIQERLRNHNMLLKTCGTTLSTCRVTTILNEQDEPEIVEMFWRIAMCRDVIVDNYQAGGICWIVGDLNTGEIGFGDNLESQKLQKIFFNHPETGQTMIRKCYPFFREVRDLALEAHGKLEDVVSVGWDIAMTPDGPVIVEMNFPPGHDPGLSMIWNGIEYSRLGELVAWRAREWIKRNVEEKSRRQIAAKWANHPG